MRAIRSRRGEKKSLNNNDCVVASVLRDSAAPFYDKEVIDLVSSDIETEAKQVQVEKIVRKKRSNDPRFNVQNQREFERISYKVKRPERRSRSRVRNNRKHHKREVTPVAPIFLWAYKRETEILKVVCENIDNRLRLVKTSSGEWKSAPLTKVRFRAPWNPSSHKNQDETGKTTGSDDNRRNDDSGDESDDESGGGSDNEFDGESVYEPKEVGPDKTAVATVEKIPKESEVIFVDLTEDSIDFVDTLSSDEDKEEQRATIDRALEMIDQDPALNKDSKVTLPEVETATLKLPEGTTIHQVKAEDMINRPAAITPSLLSPTKTPSQCTFGELTIIPQQQQQEEEQQQQQAQQYQLQQQQQQQQIQQQQQNEPLNLETVGKRSTYKLKLQEPPYKKKRNEPVKHEYDALAQLKDVLSDPKLTVPDPLIVPRDRLAALVASPAAEIPKLLQSQSPLLPPLSNTELLTISLSHLKYLLQQQPGFIEEKKAIEGTQSAGNFDQMLWSYLSSKDMASPVDNSDLIPSLLSLLMPNPPAAQQAFNYPPQKNQWNDIYYGGNIAPLYDSATTAAAAAAAAAAASGGYNKSDACYSSVSPLPPQQQQPQLQLPCPVPQKYSQMPLLQPMQSQQKSPMLPPAQQPLQKSRLPSPTVQHNVKQRVCQDPFCNSSPTTCYESCCVKNTVCNPFTTMAATGCNPYSVSPTGSFGTNAKNNCSPACAIYSSDGTATCCYSSQMDYGYSGQSTVSSMQRKSPYSRNQYNYQNHGFDHHQQRLITEYGNNGIAASNNFGVDRPYSNKSQTSPSPVATASRETVASKPVQKAKLKVKNLVDPNYKHNLINYEGALHLAKTNPQELMSSPLWHPLFSGKEDKKYDCCQWQWTTPASPPRSTSRTSGKR